MTEVAVGGTWMDAVREPWKVNSNIKQLSWTNRRRWYCLKKTYLKEFLLSKYTLYSPFQLPKKNYYVLEHGSNLYLYLKLT